MKHYYKRYNTYFLQQVCIWKQTNKLRLCVKLGIVSCFNPGNRGTIINKFTDERYFILLLWSCFCTPSYLPLTIKHYCASQGFRLIKAFYKTSENRKPREKSDCWRSMFLSHFGVGQKMQPSLSGGGKCRSSVMYC